MANRAAKFKSSLFCLMFALHGAVAQDIPGSPYSERPLNLPKLGPTGECPVSSGALGIVPPVDRYMFGGGGHFFGTGPVYLGLSWKPADRAEGRFELNARIPVTSEGYRLKTPWIMHPDYLGEALIRGAEIGSQETLKVLFNENSQNPRTTESMILRSLPESTRQLRAEAFFLDETWGFWPSSMILPEAGCYAIQIDTEAGSDIVVFEAIAAG